MIEIQIDIWRDKGQKKNHFGNNVVLRFHLEKNIQRIDFHELNFLKILFQINQSRQLI